MASALVPHTRQTTVRAMLRAGVSWLQGVSRRLLGLPQWTHPFQSGPWAGWVDSNPEFTPDFLYGSQNNNDPGALWGMRKTHPIVQPSMDERHEFLCALNYRLVPADDSVEAAACCIAVAEMWRTCSSHTLRTWVAETYDYAMTCGHCVQTVRLDDTDRMRIVTIVPREIWQFTPSFDGLTPESVLVQSRLGQMNLAMDGCAFFQRLGEPGQFRGDSAFRSVLGPQAVETEAVQSILRTMRYGAGIPYAHGQSGADESLSELDKAGLATILHGLFTGQPQAAYISKAVKLEWLASPAQALSQFGPVLQTFDARTRNAAMAGLANLGMSGVGARALGEVVQDVDETRLRRHLDATLAWMSGEQPDRATMMSLLARACGCAPELAPRIEIVWDDNSKRATLAHIEAVARIASESKLIPEAAAAEYITKNLGIADV